ncbi:hypothetical protein M8O12_16340, partial [Enterobacter kobei]|nr:hypothetical protein [Enterobacter kobei]
NRCHRQNMKTSIINGSEVSRLSVAIQVNGRKEVHYHFEKPRDVREVSFFSSRRTEETYWEVSVDNGVQH